jgi:general secretion pathway protein A
VYEQFYGFNEQPFSLTPDPRFFYRSESHQRALDELLHAIGRGEGFMLLTGDIGTGKTTLCRTLLDQLGRLTFSALVLNPFVTEEELLKAVLIDFGVVSKVEVRRGALVGASKQELIEVLNQFLLSLSGIGASAILVIDEAQNLPAATLEQVRVLTNLETDRQKLLQVLLVGQLNLVTILQSPDMRQLDQRISRRCTLQALNRLETEAYVLHRLKTAGGAALVEFDPKAFDLVHRLSGGVPRVINMLCGRALETGQHEGANVVSPEIVRAAAQQIGIEPPRRRASDRRRARAQRWVVRLAAAAALGAAGLAGAYQVARYYDVSLWRPGATRSLSAGVPSSQAPAPPPSAAIPSAQPATPIPLPTEDPGSQPPAAAAQPPAPAPVVVYSILVGSFTDRADADRGADALKTAGYLVRDVVQTEGRAEFRVLVGRYTDLALARLHADRLAQDPYFREATIVTEK